MLEPKRIADIDRSLDALEQSARSGMPQTQFVNSLLAQLRQNLSAAGSALLLPFSTGGTVVLREVGSDGQVTAEAVEELQSRTTRPAAQSPESEDGSATADGAAMGQDQGAALVGAAAGWIAAPLAHSHDGLTDWSHGALLVEFSQPVATGHLAHHFELLRAHSEITALRRWTELDRFYDEAWPAIQLLLGSLAHQESTSQLYETLVDSLCEILSADRVSLLETGSSLPTVAAISGTGEIAQKSLAVREISLALQECLASPEPLIRHSRLTGERAATDTALLENHVVVCLEPQSPPRAAAPHTQRRPIAAVLIEFDDYEPFVRSTLMLDHFLPAVSTCLAQQLRILASGGRAVGHLGAPVGNSGRQRWVRTAIGLASALALFLVLLLPVPMRIQAKGELQPEIQRPVYVPFDGFVTELLVSNGQKVVAGQPLVQMHAVELEKQLQELEGKLSENAENQNGLKVTLNQLAAEGKSTYAQQSRLSAQIKQLQTEKEYLEKQHIFVADQARQMRIVASIDGIVVAEELERYLDSRPLRRGDALFRIVDFDSSWRLELQVKDSDSGYVRRALASTGKDPVGPNKIRFTVASSSQERHTAVLTWMANRASQSAQEGPVVEMHALPKEEDVDWHMGATAYAQIDCGHQPLWFVWSRPLVEAVQRRLWF